MKNYFLIVGSRDFNDYDYLVQCCNCLLKGKTDIVIVSGGAKGADTLAKMYAKENNYEYVEFRADWNKYGKMAGYIRNEEMHKYISRFDNRKVVAFWDGQSKGTQHNFSLSEKYKNDIIAINYNNNTVVKDEKYS